jgi:hypothetical protein
MQYDQSLMRLDKLVADIGGADFGTRSEGRCGLLLEHLQAARRDLMGSMPGEYGLSLQQAEESLSCISDKNDRNEIKKALRTLLEPDGPAQRRSVA